MAKEDPAGLFVKDKVGTLELQDGSKIVGVSFGADRPMSGEVVFNTGMVGYPEALTDPSYRGQILVLTYPLIGNYGVPDREEKDEFGLPAHFESNEVQIAGLIVADYSPVHSHWNARSSLSEWLCEAGVPALHQVDTRALTKKLRVAGSMLGRIVFEGKEAVALENPFARNLVAEVSIKEPRVFNKGNSPRILAVDCGIKYNIIRYLARLGVELTVVPFDYDLASHEDDYDGLFLSNGPGDPEMAAETVSQLRRILELAAKKESGKRVKPVFGICLGNQLLGLASGAKTYKMKFGNRGMNQPCIDLRTTRCYITPQNHGFAVDGQSLSPGWRPFFLNANDLSNEGIIHESLPFMSVQFHPESRGGPMDTDFLFDLFLQQVRGMPPAITTVDSSMYLSRPTLVRRVLLLGSGGLSIGQAGEFDYSGSQAIKALKEEGKEVILINPNIATVQTSKGLADKVYFLPVTPAFVKDVILRERPDSILVSMGGQTALNVGVALHDSGDLERLGVKVLGTPIEAIKATEDREVFARKLAEIDESIALSYAASSVDEAVEAANKIGYPVLVRAAFALGGLGSGFAVDEAELRELAHKAFSASDQILIDQDLRGWKEVEYEVVRDAMDNCVTVCNMENFDPLGVHTGDSIVVAPSQTLSNSEYFMLRRTALKVVRHLGIVGECNIQYALHPESERYCIIEVNARLSRSSALASKATGYPLAYVATKLALGSDLVSVRNSVTKTTTACFEPSLDYCVVKVPRWDLKKFSMVSNKIGSSMKSVGEVMAIARTFEEAFQKAMRMVNPALSGWETGIDSPMAATPHLQPDRSASLPGSPAGGGGGGSVTGTSLSRMPDLSLDGSSAVSTVASSMLPRSSSDDGVYFDKEHGADVSSKTPQKSSSSSSETPKKSPPEASKHSESPRRSRRTPKKLPDEELSRRLSVPSDTRVVDLAEAFGRGWGVERIHQLTKIDRWFLSKLQRITDLSSSLRGRSLADLDVTAMRRLKRAGFSDRQIASRVRTSELAVRRTRKEMGVVPVVKQIDTLAAEFPAQTNYLYMTYNGDEHDVAPAPRAVIVLGSGPYCIGSSVEFDWCAVSAVRALRSAGIPAVVMNSNPETVSTDYDESDQLFFEELTLERVLDVTDREAPRGVIVSVGGQIPNTLAMPLHEQGVRILGTSPVDIDRAEDRFKFSQLLDSIGVDQPEWSELASAEDVEAFVRKTGFPVIVRPSYVLSGAAMRVATSETELRGCLEDAVDVSPEHPVVVSKFIENAKEIEFDAVAKDGRILNYAISEHIENAGVHSGDATLVLPAQKLYVETIRKVKRISAAIARALRITGPFNMQFISKDNDVKVIECNLRASRTFPFVSKTFDFNFITLATRCMVDLPVKPASLSLVDLDYVGCKAPMFSFTRLQGADPTLGVEMMSTGEVACFGRDLHEAFLKSLLSSGFKIPARGANILISVSSRGKKHFADSCDILHRLGYKIHATEGTHAFLSDRDIPNTLVHKPSSGKEPNAIDLLSNGFFKLVINDPGSKDRDAVTDGYRIRRTTVDFGISLITNIQCAVLLANSLEKVRSFSIRHMDEFYTTAAAPPE